MKETSLRKFRWLTLKYLAYDYNIISHKKQKEIVSQTYNAFNFDRLKNISESQSYSDITTCKNVKNINLAGYLITYKLQQFSVNFFSEHTLRSFLG